MFIIVDGKDVLAELYPNSHEELKNSRSILMGMRHFCYQDSPVYQSKASLNTHYISSFTIRLRQGRWCSKQQQPLQKQVATGTFSVTGKQFKRGILTFFFTEDLHLCTGSHWNPES